MPKPARRSIIGYYGFTQDDRSPRLLSGILECRRNRGDFDLYHYLIDVLQTFENSSAPPWKDRVDGILIGATIGGDVDVAIDWVRSGRAPAVSMVSNVIDRRFPVVIADPASIARLAMQELSRCGCRSFLFVGFRPSAGSRLRGEAMELAALKTGQPFSWMDTDWVFSEAVPEDPVENQKLAELLHSQPRPVGVHTLNDPLGRRVLRICQDHALRVPEDVAIVAADDTPLAFEQRPMLTSVCNPGEKVGSRAAELLCELIAGRRTPSKPILVPATKIVIRETTGGIPEADDVVRALEIIRRKATLGLKVHDLANSLGVNRRTLERVFRERLERTPAFEIQRMRMIAARELLRETKFSIGRVAALVGYAEPAAFSNAFYRETGLWPKEYRRQPPIGVSRRK